MTFFRTNVTISLTLLVFCLVLLPHSHAQRINPIFLDKTMQDSMEAWEVPGAAVVIVIGDRIVYLKGFGVRQLGKQQPVTADTLFALGSCSKPFTTLLLAMLADIGKLNWDDPVRKHLPTFRLFDPLANANVTLRDLVTHRTGIDSHDLLWYRTPWSVEDQIRKLVKLKPSESFRSTFQYQSIMFNAAGLAASSSAKSPWANLVQKHILTPLRMKNSCLTTTAALESKNYALPHWKQKEGKIETRKWYRFREAEPAGSVNSTARDLGNWLRLQLTGGVFQGKRLVSERHLLETRTPQVALRLHGPARTHNPDTLMLSYGMGWVIKVYRGHLVHLHGGSIDGFRVQMTLLPKANAGFAILSNLQGTYMNTAASNHIIDHILGLPSKNWDQYFQKIVKFENRQEQLADQTFWNKRRTDTKTTHSLEKYTGTYEESVYGNIVVSLADGKLRWKWSSFDAVLEHYHYDTFRVVHPHLIRTLAVFRLGEDGSIAGISVLDREFQKKSG